MEFDTAYHAGVVVEVYDFAACYYVPQRYCSIVGTGGYHPRVQRKLRAPNPILMPAETHNKSTLLNIPHLNKLIIASGD